MTLTLPQLRGSNLLTHSRMQAFKTCPKLHYNRYELGIRRRQSAQPLRMGSAVHLGLDIRAQGRSVDEALEKAVESYVFVPDWANTDELVLEWLIERQIVLRLLAGYFWYWERPEVPDSLRPVEIIESERSYELPIRNPSTGGTSTVFRQAGKRDKIVRLGDSALVVMEHKTTGESLEVGSDYWRRLELDQQISGYVNAARDEGHDVTDVLYDVIRKPSIEPRQVPILDSEGFKIVNDASGQRVFNKNGKPRESASKEDGWTLQVRRETPTEFGDRLAADIGARPEFYFARRRIPRMQVDLDEFRAELWQQQQAIREAQKNGRWYRNTAACTLRGRCEFLDHCRNGIDLNNLPSGFERVLDVHPELVDE